jgi:hypothetical protein
VTPEKERELFKLLNRIDRRLRIIGGWLIGVFAVFIANYIYEDARGKQGSLIALIVSIAVFGGIIWYFGRRLSNDD